jgi:uncharacterized protein (TIGR02996 family)
VSASDAIGRSTTSIAHKAERVIMQSTISDAELGFHAGIDKGDETALGAFADWLEERDDPRAEGYRFLRDKGVIPERPDSPRGPWRYGYQDTRQELIDALSEGKRLALRVACALTAAHDAESVLHLFENYLPGDPAPRRAIESLKHWIVVPPTETNSDISDLAQAAHRSASEIVRWDSLSRAARCAASAASTAVIIARADTAKLEAFAASDAVAVTEEVAYAVTFASTVSVGELSAPMTEQAAKVAGAALAARWVWIDCVYQHIVLIPEELADRFVRSVPLHFNTTRREITDAFALAFAAAPPTAEG